MKILKFKIITSLIVGLTFSMSSKSQVKVSEILQQSSIVKTDASKLYFVDFWATWCGPCKYSKKILTVLQTQFPNDFHAISISEENPDKVERFLKKNPTLLTIAIDDYGSTFKKFGIQSLPEGILLDANGKQLWKGHPADLKPSDINGFLKKAKARKTLTEFVEIVDEGTIVEKEYFPKNAFEVSQINKNFETIDIYNNPEFVRLKGKLSDILSCLSKTYKGQIELPKDLDKTYQVYIKKPLQPETNYGLHLIENLNFEFKETTVTGEVVSLSIDKPQFWDTNQIDWDRGEATSLIGDTEIMANDTSFKDLSYIIAKTIDLPVVISFKNTDDINSLHDWQVHYKYFQFMQSNLLDYGIEAKKIKTEYPKYQVIKKAP